MLQGQGRTSSLVERSPEIELGKQIKHGIDFCGLYAYKYKFLLNLIFKKFADNFITFEFSKLPLLLFEGSLVSS